MVQDGSLLDRINKLIESGSLNLPVYNPVVLQLQEVLSKHSQNVDEVERLLVMDQSLAAEILRAANSPFYCGLSPIRTVRNAIVRLGMKPIQHLIVLASEQEKYQANDADVDTMLKELWRHASTTALAAQWLANRLHSANVEEECFLGGLMHDIGKLIILRAIDKIKKTEGDQFFLPPELLEEILRTAHCELGFKLLQEWNLPEIYCRIARDHHADGISSADIPLAIVRLANESTKRLGVDLNANPGIVLAATPEASLLKTSEILLAELEVMLEDHLSQAP
jgi:putative nucleotidyltransferase with HDIG domain